MVFESGLLGFSGDFPNHTPDRACSDRGAKLVDVISPTFFLVSLIVRVFALRSLIAFRLMIVSSLLNFHKTAFHRWIAVIYSSLNQGVLHLFEAEVFALVSFAIEIRVSAKCLVWSMMFGSYNRFYLQRVSKTFQFAKFIFQWRSLSLWRGCKFSSMIGEWALLQRSL